MSDSNNQMPKLTPEQIKQLLALQQSAGSNNMTRRQVITQKFFSSLIKNMQGLIHHLDRFINFITRKVDGERGEVVQAARAPILFGTYIIIIFVGVGGIWSAIAPLDSAAVAMGVVTSSTNKKRIQHPEGGIIKHILVNQGDKVKAGEKLIELDDTRIKTQYEATLNQYRTALAAEARLVAERDNSEIIEFSDFLIQNRDILEVEKLMISQENLFRSKKEIFRAEKDSLRQRISQAYKEIEGLEARKVGLQKNLEITVDRLKAIKTLLNKGFTNKSTVLEMEGREATLRSEIAGVETGIAKTEQEITRANIEIINLQNKFATDSLRELKETEAQVAGLREQLAGQQDILSRVVIKSPVDGIINSLEYHTIGGVIAPGNQIMEISPVNDFLLIEAKVPQKNIDSVHVGLEAKIRFSAFKSRTTPLFKGKIISISPDTVQDRNAMPGERAADTYYIARIEINMEEFNKIAKSRKIELHPGMQAEVQIITGTRTLLRYLLDPVIDTMFRAFREK